ncbi:hypothetical protein AB0L68_03700 [Streptomyces sp. NPDC052164]|uniref:hypothetical protein n=1 Tax=Streptomyces sp. NPDC052164 TaxID=3155529 RepID=UPI00341CC640
MSDDGMLRRRLAGRLVSGGHLRTRPWREAVEAWADGNVGWTARQGGPDRLWDAVEEHVTRWRSDGSPSLDRFEITVAPSRQSITWPSEPE